MLTINKILQMIPSRYASKEGKPVTRRTFNRWRAWGWFPAPDRYIQGSPMWDESSVRHGLRSLRGHGVISP